MSIKDVLTSFFSSISIKFGKKPDSIKEMEFQQKYINKRNRNFRKNQYKRLFAECSISELRVIQELIKDNNEFIEVNTDKINIDRQLYHRGINENLFQIDDTFEDEYYDDCYKKIRINVIIYKKIIKEFKKHGELRIPNNEGNTEDIVVSAINAEEIQWNEDD